jgi:hypothetical protein
LQKLTLCLSNLFSFAKAHICLNPLFSFAKAYFLCSSKYLSFIFA